MSHSSEGSYELIFTPHTPTRYGYIKPPSWMMSSSITSPPPSWILPKGFRRHLESFVLYANWWRHPFVSYGDAVLLTFLHKMLSFFIFSKVIVAVLWRLTLIHRNISVADTTMAEMVKRHSSTRLLWSGENFTQISKIFIPMNKSGNHRTLLVRTLR